MNDSINNTLLKKISDIDTKIFKKKAIISILNKSRFMETACAQYIHSKNIFWRLFIKDEYVIYGDVLESFFKNISADQEKIDRYLSMTACHEVRHRFQMYNPTKIIPSLFFEKNKDNPLISSVIRDTEIKGYPSEQIKLLELDANLVTQLVSVAYWNKEIDLSEIVTADQENIHQFIKKLGLLFD